MSEDPDQHHDIIILNDDAGENYQDRDLQATM